ncbi:hypothetical protein AWC22_19285 [Mycobacterium riyadhense]|uniref:Major facilitator superfamily (MFS) profile domain-containing protein n=1 Tax=Mycobacterium riyadhense TaxID=486698 RepID=A0A1X2CRU4_9MYCO|nr:hypothetical protein AWC22_19285 [Mycobacterium riyadhense]
MATDRRYSARANVSSLSFVSNVAAITVMDRVPSNDPAVTPAESVRVGYPAVIRLLLGGYLLVRSAGFAYPFLAYHVAQRGHAAGAVGLVLAVYGLGWAAGQLLSGWLIDRFGARTTLMSTMSVAAVVLVLMAGAHTVPALLVAAMVAGLVSDAPRPVLGAAIAEMVPDPRQRAKLDSWRYGWSLNLGAAIAGGVGGLIAGWVGTPVLYWINGIACATFAMVAARWMPAQVHNTTRKAGYRQAFSDSRLLLMCMSSVATLTAVMGFFAAVPMLMRDCGLGAGAYGWVQMSNALAVIALTPLLTPWLSRRLALGPGLDILAGAGVWVTLCMAAAGLVHTTAGFSAAVAVGAPGEIAWFVVGAGLVHRITPRANGGVYQGIWSMTTAISSVIAPLLTCWSLGHGGRAMVAVGTVAVGLLGAALCSPLARVLAYTNEFPAES